MSEYQTLRFIKLPKDPDTKKELKEFKSMLGYTYSVILSDWTGEYIVCGGETKEAELAFEEAIYKSLVAIGEDEDFARKCAKGEEDPGMCLYFEKECFEEVRDKTFRVVRFADVTILYIGKILSISKFKEGCRKIRKIDYKKYHYNWAVNFGLFYIAFSKNIYKKGWSIDINSKLGLLRIIRW